MTAQKSPPKPRRKFTAPSVARPTKLGGTYRGIRLVSMADRSQFTEEEVEAAVKAAIAKNPHVFKDG